MIFILIQIFISIFFRNSSIGELVGRLVQIKPMRFVYFRNNDFGMASEVRLESLCALIMNDEIFDANR